MVAITGAASGIGLACAKRFAGCGDHVVLIDRDRDGVEARAADLGQMAIHADVAIEADVVACFDQIAERFSRLDVLVNNAGVVDAAATPAITIGSDECRRLLAVNLHGSFVAAREAAQMMVARGGGAIVNLASLAGVVAIPNRTAYSMSKAAILGLTRNLACEWASSGVRVNAVLPGYVATSILRSLIEQGKVDVAAVERRIPLGRLAEPGEIAEAVFHLASTDAGFTTGASIVVDGGYQAFGGTGAASAGGAVSMVPHARQRSALVTGAASGIGAEIARRLASENYRLILFDRDEDGLAAIGDELGDQHQSIVGDVRSSSDAARAVSLAVARVGSLDALVNNVGVADAFEPTLDQRLESFVEGVEVNLVSALTMAQVAAPAMFAAGGGAIVNMASIAGLLGLPRRNAYAASKSGIIMLTRSLACEWAAHGVRVNAVAPGYVNTPGVAALERSGKRDLGEIRRRTPMGRLGTPEEVAGTVAFLLSDASAYMTGTTMSVDGGWSAYGDAGPASE